MGKKHPRFDFIGFFLPWFSCGPRPVILLFRDPCIRARSSGAYSKMTAFMGDGGLGDWLKGARQPAVANGIPGVTCSSSASVCRNRRRACWRVRQSSIYCQQMASFREEACQRLMAASTKRDFSSSAQARRPTALGGRGRSRRSCRWSDGTSTPPSDPPGSC